MIFSKLKISYKLHLGFGVFAGLMLLISGFTYISFRQVASTVDANLLAYQVMQESSGMLNSLVGMATSLRDYTITGEDDDIRWFHASKTNFSMHYDRMKKLLPAVPLQKGRLDKLYAVYQGWLEEETSILDARQSEVKDTLSGQQNNVTPLPEKPQNASEMLRAGRDRAEMDQLKQMLAEIDSEQKQQLELKGDILNDIKMKTYLTILFGAVIAALSAIFILFLFSRMITKPINMLIRAAKNIAEQHYSEPIELESGADIGILVKTFNTMQATIHEREVELNRKNEAIRIKMEEVDEANKLKSQFLANVSHELRTPLNSIIGFTVRVIKKSAGILPQEQLEEMEIVRSQGNHLLDLINDLLDYSTMEAGRMKLYFKDFNLIEVIDEVHSITEPLMEGKPLTYEQELYRNDYIRIISDRYRVRQILLNLLSNAIKYTEKGNIKLSVHKVENVYCIQVKDEGIGIAEENLETIFDEFCQIDGTSTRKAGGTGLGLSITKKLTEMLGGRIEVESAVGVGSCFTVYLPFIISSTPDIGESAENEGKIQEKTI